MYTMALVILTGLVAQTVVSVATDHIPFLKQIPIISKGEGWLIAACILLVWLMDVSVLGTFMGANGANLESWVDIVGSGLAIAGFTHVTANFQNFLARLRY